MVIERGQILGMSVLTEVRVGAVGGVFAEIIALFHKFLCGMRMCGRT